MAEHGVALDIAEAAIERARARGLDRGRVEFRAQNVMEFDVGGNGPWDLVVLSETIYCLGWLYHLSTSAGLPPSCGGALEEGGRLLLVNAYGQAPAAREVGIGRILPISA